MAVVRSFFWAARHFENFLSGLPYAGLAWGGPLFSLFVFRKLQGQTGGVNGKHNARTRELQFGDLGQKNESYVVCGQACSGRVVSE